MKTGKVNITGSEYSNNILVPEEVTIQLTDIIAIKYELNKENKSVNISVINTLFDVPEQKGEISKDNFQKMLNGGNSIFRQLD